MNLSDFKGMSWKKARLLLGKNAHLLALSHDNASLEIAKTAENEGVDAGMAALVAHLFIQKHGYASTARMGITIYRELIEELKKTRTKKAYELRKKMDNTEEWLYFHSGYNRAFRKVEWPLKPCFKKIDERAGLANIMLAISAREFFKAGGSSDILAGTAIVRLLDGGKMKAKRK
jgi:hypothetical protein